MTLAVSIFDLLTYAVPRSLYLALLSHLATLKTLELCFWLPDIDDKCRTPSHPGTDRDQ